MKQRIKVEGKNIGELFALPCVRCITKTDHGDYKAKVKIAIRTYTYAGTGDWLVEEDDGTWHVEKGDKDMKEE